MAVGRNLPEITFADADESRGLRRRKCPDRLLRQRGKDFGLMLLKLIGQLLRIRCQKRRKVLLIILKSKTRLHDLFPT